jgi:hypothetical protein
VSSRFDMFILFFILLNALLLAIVSYDLDCVNNENVPVSTGDCYSNLIVERAEIIFTVVFAFEMFVKIFAFGFYSGSSVPGTYMKDMWSWLDFVVVISSFVAIIMEAFDTEFINLSVLRIFRVLRPLKVSNCLRSAPHATSKSCRTNVAVSVLMLCNRACRSCRS